MAVGQRQRLYSGVRIFTGNYLSSTPRALRIPGVELELTPLILYCIYNNAHRLRLRLEPWKTTILLSIYYTVRVLHAPRF